MNAASPFTLSLVIVVVGFAAGLVPFFFQWTHRTAHRWIAFGAGTMLGAAFLHMLPEGAELAGSLSITMALAGFVVLYLVEQLSLKHPHEEDEGEFTEIGFLAFLGLTIHDLVDGISLGAGHDIPAITPAIFLALVLHKIPNTFSLSLLLLHGGYSKKKVLLFLSTFLVAIPIGALLSEPLISLMGPDHNRAIGALVGFSSGTFVYIAAYELLPEMQRKATRGSWIGLFFILGVAVMMLLRMLHPVF
jgi:Predicted divalent heavy-metal cations transporter